VTCQRILTTHEPTNHLKAVEKVKAPRGRLRYLKSDEKARLFQELTTPWYLMPISMLAVYTGMRRGDDNLIGGVVGPAVG
jgi:hypothetical protein